MNEQMERLIGGLENCIENARLRNDAYDVGYMEAMLKEARALLASSEARDAARYRCLRNCYSTDERMDVVDQLDEEMDSSLDAAIAKEPK